MAKAPKKVAPKPPEKEPQADEVIEPAAEAEAPTVRRIELIGKYLHSVGINGTVRQYLGGEPLVVEENTYHILKDAGLIGKEF